MADRHTLALSKVNEFKKWLEENGWNIELTASSYELLRARHPKRKIPLIVYLRDNAKVHASVRDCDYPVIKQFIRETKKMDLKGGKE